MELNISKKDFNTLKTLVEQLDTRSQTREVRQLSEELKKMNVLETEMMPENAIGLNSEVDIHEQSSDKKMKFKITLPSFADIKAKRVSVFAPISIALLGFKQGDIIEWKMPGGLKKLKVIKVVNQRP